jgi:Di-haem cytochrome c peroxidase
MTERRCIYIGLLGLVVALIGMAIPWYGRAAADVLGGPLPAPTLSSDIVQLTPVEKLGKLMLYDSTLSNPPGYSCATCHVPETGFTGPNSEINAFSGPQPGVVPGRFSNRKPQSYLYAAFSPVGPPVSVIEFVPLASSARLECGCHPGGPKSGCLRKAFSDEA